MAQLVSRHSCVADRLPVVVRFPAGPGVRLKTVDPPKGNGLGQKKSAAEEGAWVRIQPVEGPVLDLRAKETCLKKGQKVDPLEIKSGPPLEGPVLAPSLWQMC